MKSSIKSLAADTAERLQLKPYNLHAMAIAPANTKKLLLSRKIYAEIPPRVEYFLSGKGRSLMPVIDAMRIWGDKHVVNR